MNTLPVLHCLACSGRGAAFAIESTILIGKFAAAINGVMYLALLYDYVRRRNIDFTFGLSTIMMLLHPAWTISAIHGDCGSTKLMLTVLYMMGFVMMLIYRHRKFGGKRPDPTML